ncbi:hypothetical protein ACFS3C_04335 [Azotobacter vinelandii]
MDMDGLSALIELAEKKGWAFERVSAERLDICRSTNNEGEALWQHSKAQIFLSFF